MLNCESENSSIGYATINLRYPFRLFFLAKEPRHTQCELRRQVATEILDGHPMLDSNAKKLKVLCHDDLKEASRTGTLSKRWKLFATIRGLSMIMFTDVQAIEGLNNIIKLIQRRSPRVSLALMSSRILLKHQLKDAEGGDSKWHEIKDAALSAYRTMLRGYSESDRVLGEPGRWSPPSAANDLPSDDQIERGMLAALPTRPPRDHLRWATAMSLLLQKTIQKEIVELQYF